MTRALPVLALVAVALTPVASVADAAADTSGQTGDPACTAGDVTAHYRPQDAAMSHRFGVIRIKNVSDRACSVHGYGGLSYVGNRDGSQIGAPADREARRVRTVVLQPGGHAVSSISETVAEVYPKGRCRPEAVDGFRVYLPGETRSLFVPHATTGCDNTAVHLLTHRPFR